MSAYIVCWKCKRSVEPAQRFEKDKKSKKTWIITYCPYERCLTNLDLEEMNVKLWNGHTFIDY